MTNRIVFVLLALIAVICGVWFSLHQSSKKNDVMPEIAGFVYPEAKPLSAMQLIDQNGEPFGLGRFKDKWSFLYFGYTYCPDVCPLTLSELKTAGESLSENGLGDNNQYILVSVDPERDTPARLAEYTGFFGQSFSGVTGDNENLETFTREIGVVFAANKKDQNDKDYLVDHSSTIALLDPDAQLHAIFTTPHKADQIADGFKKIVQRWRALRPEG